MDYNDFKEFFKVHVKQYGPYRDSKMFQSFSNFLIDSYYNDSYTNIPVSFKASFEKQVLSSEFVVPFLLSLGIPMTEIDKISNSDRFKIINTISDFHRYKGTITLIDNLVTNFDIDDNIAIYELYLDMSVDVNGSKLWEIIPSMIKSGTGVRQSLKLTKKLPFSLLDRAPNWFIDTVTLGDLYDAGELELPYKTNCILLDSTILNRIEPIIQIISELVLETLKDDKIQLFFSDGIYLTTFSNMNAIWYYIFHKIHLVGNSTIPGLNANMISGSKIFNRYVVPNLDGSLPRGGSDLLNAPLTNIQTLITEYANLVTSDVSSKTNIDNFYNTYIDIFSGSNSSKIQTFAQYRSSVIAAVGNELITYIDNRLDTSLNLTNEANLISSELYGSILSYKTAAISSTSINFDYLDYYFLNLPGLLKDIKNSTTYIMLNLLKPYHTDLLDQKNQKVVASSKFNNALVGYASIFQTIYSKVINAESSERSVTDTKINNYESIMLLNSSIFNMIYSSLLDSTKMQVSHKDLFQLMTMYASINNVSEFLNNIATFKNYDNIPVTDIVTSYTYDNPILGIHTVYTN